MRNVSLERFPPQARIPSDMAALQQQGLLWTVRHAWANSPFYRSRFEAAGVTPDAIGSLDDITKLPFTTADDLRDGYPFPLLSVPERDVVRIHSSSGTTGKRKVLSYTARDIDDWADMFGRCYEMAGLTTEDRVQICVGYGLWTAGAGFQLGCERFGALAIPVGPGNLDIQVQFLVDLKSTVLCSTASMALLMAEEVNRRGMRGDIALKKVICGAERTSDAMRETIKDLLGVEEVFDIPGLTELYGPGTGLSCGNGPGIHYWADYYILEIIDPDTLQPVKPGETGEMVVTTLRKEASPLIRYRTRDLTRFITDACPCGCSLPRHDRIMGRSDDMFILRGVNVYPGQIDAVLSAVPGAGSEYQVVLTRKDDGKDYMTLRLEQAAAAQEHDASQLSKTVASALKHALMVSSAVDIVPYGSLPRTERKTKRVFDERSF